MNPVYDKLQKCLKCVREKVDFVPDVALVLGSGLGDYADTMKVVSELSYKDIDGFPVSTAPGHKGRFVFEENESVENTPSGPTPTPEPHVLE